MDWYNELKNIGKGMPSVANAPDVGLPEESPPPSDVVIKDLEDDEVAHYYHLSSKWKAYADYAVGMYAAAEIAYAQNLANIKHDVYLELFSHTKPKNANEGEVRVESDPRVREATKEYNEMRQGHVLYKSKASQYMQLAMTYGNERKDRREKDQRGLFSE